jgi:hypothetical protein
MGVPFIFAGQAGPLPLSELDADFAFLAGTPNIAPFTSDSTGRVTLPAPVGGTGAAMTVQGSVTTGAAQPVLNIVQNDTTNGSGGLQVTSSVAHDTNVAVINTVNSGTTFTEIVMFGGSATDNASLIMTNPNWAASGGTSFPIVGLPAGQNFIISAVNGNSGVGGWPICFVTGGTVRMIINGAGVTTVAPTVSPAAGGSAACGIQASSTANLGLFFGTGAPTFSAAQGSIYSNTTGGAGARLYVNTSGSTTWTPLTTP